jgi:hypothetical protein
VFTLNFLLHKRSEEARRVLKRVVTASLVKFTVGERNDKEAILVQFCAKLALLLNAAHQCCRFNLKLTKEEKGNNHM